MSKEKHELAKAVKILFLCEYLNSEELRREIHEGLIHMLCLHLLIYINTLVLEEILEKPPWMERLTTEELRAFTPLIFTHIKAIL